MANTASTTRANARTSTTPHPWWDRLPDDFWRHTHDIEFDGLRQLQVNGVAAMEHLARVPLAATVATAMGSSLMPHGRAASEVEALRFYEPLARAGDASRVFMAPPKGIKIEERPLPDMWMNGARAKRRALSFDSPFVPLNPAARPGFASAKRNKVAHAQHWCHGDKSRPTLLVLHGFAADAPWVNAHMLSLHEFYDAGYDLLLYTFPHHGPRAEAGSPVSGWGVFGNGLLHFNEVTLQGICELRAYLDHLQSRGVGRIGVTGISLGGYTAALLATVDERIDFCIPIVPAVSPIDAFLEWQPTSLLLSHLMRSQDLGVAQMRSLVAVHNPLTYAPRMAGERALIIGGAGDRVTAPHHVHLLHAHWPGSTMHWFPGNHLLHFGRRDYLRLMREHVARWARD